MKTLPYLQRAQQGFALVSSILLLLVVTILAVSMFRSYGIQEKIAGNVREKQRALHAAQIAEQYAEIWLTNNATQPAITCGAGLINGNSGLGQICSNSILVSTGNPSTTVPWQSGGVNVGVTYTPPTAGAVMTINTTAAQNTYYEAPRFYIEEKGTSAAGGQGKVYQIDAVGYGGTASAVAVVRTTFQVSTDSWDISK